MIVISLTKKSQTWAMSRGDQPKIQVQLSYFTGRNAMCAATMKNNLALSQKS